MYIRAVPVLFEQVLVDQVDVRDVLYRLLEVGVVLDIYSVRHNDVRDVTRAVDILRAYGDFDFSPCIHSRTLAEHLLELVKEAAAL